ncbi:orexin/Hypocretin receptor type 1-like [Dreissena polymorpha]|uniref:orexin/Hypocretin receptor type 1-like n=1 Tax=Dreissena polymorpha TaxID=45954 RepID=UPI0022648879|nr:orexin/Hypocretin receptor type 1-like [Dreissena polymorpha]
MCYLPSYVLNIARYTSALDPLKANRAAIVCVFWTARFLNYFNSAINPVIYNFMSVKFRKQFKTACFGCYVHLRFCCFFLRRKRPLRRRPTHMPMTILDSRRRRYKMLILNIYFFAV